MTADPTDAVDMAVRRRGCLARRTSYEFEFSISFAFLVRDRQAAFRSADGPIAFTSEQPMMGVVRASR